MIRKVIKLQRSGDRLDLLIERDSGNEVLILMGGIPKLRLQNWLYLKHIVDKAVREVKSQVRV